MKALKDIFLSAKETVLSAFGYRETTTSPVVLLSVFVIAVAGGVGGGLLGMLTAQVLSAGTWPGIALVAAGAGLCGVATPLACTSLAIGGSKLAMACIPPKPAKNAADENPKPAKKKLLKKISALFNKPANKAKARKQKIAQAQKTSPAP